MEIRFSHILGIVCIKGKNFSKSMSWKDIGIPIFLHET